MIKHNLTFFHPVYNVYLSVRIVLVYIHVKMCQICSNHYDLLRIINPHLSGLLYLVGLRSF